MTEPRFVFISSAIALFLLAVRYQSFLSAESKKTSCASLSATALLRLLVIRAMTFLDPAASSSLTIELRRAGILMARLIAISRQTISSSRRVNPRFAATLVKNSSCNDYSISQLLMSASVPSPPDSPSAP